MKKIILLLTVTMFTSASFAQMNLNYGITAGASISTLTNKSTSGTVSASTNYKAGLRAGGFVELGIATGMAIQADVLYNQMGGTSKNASNGSKATINLDYLAIPINFKYSIPNVTGLGVFAGPQIGVLLGASVKTPEGSLDASEVKRSFNTIDFAGNVGVQYQLPIGIRFSAAYQYSFGNALKQKEDNGTTLLSGNAVNSAFGITVGYAFGGKK